MVEGAAHLSRAAGMHVFEIVLFRENGCFAVIIYCLQGEGRRDPAADEG